MKTIIFVIVSWLSVCCGYVTIDTIDKFYKKAQCCQKKGKETNNG